MLQRRLAIATVFIAGMIFAYVARPVEWVQSIAQAQGSCQTFNETGKTVCGKFLTYWQQHGGLAQQGYPISNAFSEVSDLNGKTYTVQYFERSVFEDHPENQAPYDVLLSQLGTFQFQRKYPTGEPGQAPPAPAPTPTTPASQGQSIIGQTVKYSLFSSSKGIIQATVTDVKEAATIPAGSIYPELAAKGKFVIVFVDVVNVGTESTAASFGVKLKDGSGRNFDPADVEAMRNAAEQFGVDPAQETLQPGIPSKTVLVFDTAKDATGYLLVGNR